MRPNCCLPWTSVAPLPTHPPQFSHLFLWAWPGLDALAVDMQKEKKITNQTVDAICYRQASNPFLSSPGRKKNLISCHSRSEIQLQDVPVVICLKGNLSFHQQPTAHKGDTKCLCHHCLHQPLVNGPNHLTQKFIKGHSKLHFACWEGLILHGHRTIAAQDRDTQLLLPLQGLCVPLVHHQWVKGWDQRHLEGRRVWLIFFQTQVSPVAAMHHQ